MAFPNCGSTTRNIPPEMGRLRICERCGLIVLIAGKKRLTPLVRAWSELVFGADCGVGPRLMGWRRTGAATRTGAAAAATSPARLILVERHARVALALERHARVALALERHARVALGARSAATWRGRARRRVVLMVATRFARSPASGWGYSPASGWGYLPLVGACPQPLVGACPHRALAIATGS